MDYSQFLLMKEELSLILVIIILFVADLFMSPDAHKNNGKPVLNTMLPVALLAIHTPVSYTLLDVYKRQFLYLVIIIISILLMMGMGIGFLESVGCVISSIGNMGPGLGETGPAYSWSALPHVAKWLLSFLMLLGRLELFTVLLLFTPEFWKRN